MMMFQSLLVASCVLGAQAFAPIQPAATRTSITDLHMIGGLFQGFFGQKDAEITDTVFFDLDIDGQPAGRIEIGLYGSVVPKTAENFKQVRTYTICLPSALSSYREVSWGNHNTDSLTRKPCLSFHLFSAM
jgi:hypothetical protein